MALRPLVTARSGARLSDGGSVLAEHVAVAALVTLVFASLVQLSLALHVRTVLLDAASEGARHGALADRTPADGAQRTRELIAERLDPRYATDVRVAATSVGGLPALETTVRAPLPVVGFAGTATTVTVSGRGLLPPPPTPTPTQP